jgi:hypothetical protein
MTTLSISPLGVLSACLGLALMSVSPAKGDTFVVSETNDTTAVTSLRGAVIEANRRGGNNTIILGRQATRHQNPQKPWIFRLTIPGANEDAARTGDLDITRGHLTIAGANTNVTIDATGLGDRVFQIMPRARLTLENLKITGGAAAAGSGIFANGEPGGAILNAGTLILENCIITNNSSGAGKYVEGNGGGTGGGDGGGIYNSGKLTMNNCSLVGNIADSGFDGAPGGNGGGIRNDGLCLLTDCLIGGNQSGAGGSPAGNSGGFGGSGGNGGGIFNSGTMILNECMVCANVAGPGAGGSEPSGTLTIYSPGGEGGDGGTGGGIYNAGQMEINFSSVYDNSAGSGGNGGSFGAGGNGGTGGNGGGIFNASGLKLNTSTISGNFCGEGGNGGYGSTAGGAAGGNGGSGAGLYNMQTTFLLLANPTNPFAFQSGYYTGSLTLTSSTITLNECGAGGNGGNGSSFNSTPGAAGGNGGDGGGVLNAGAAAAVSLRNTLIAQNLANAGGAGGTNIIEMIVIMPGEQPSPQMEIGDAGADGVGFDVAGDFTSQKFNLIGMADGSTGFTNGASADHAGSNASPINPLLGPLQMNGGFTPTHALLWGSPAINQGACFGIHQDQRGHYRPYVFSSVPIAPGGDGSDIGAFELDTP